MFLRKAIHERLCECGKELRRRDANCLSQIHNIFEPQVALTAFDLRQIRPMNTCAVRDLFLSQAIILSEPTQSCSEHCAHVRHISILRRGVHIDHRLSAKPALDYRPWESTSFSRSDG